MKYSAMLITSLALLVGGGAMASETPNGTDPVAVLTIRGAEPMLNHTSYGIVAIDAQPLFLADRVSIEVAPGTRTVAFLCPGSSPGQQGTELSYDFQSGRNYELSCALGEQGTIREVDNC